MGIQACRTGIPYRGWCGGSVNRYTQCGGNRGENESELLKGAWDISQGKFPGGLRDD